MRITAPNKPDAALQTLDTAIDVVTKTGERTYLAELYRRRGVVHRTKGDFASAEADFAEALTIARAQDAKAWELRAAIDFSRLYQAQGKPATEIRALLKPIVDWFTEGVDTSDFKTATRLLAEL